MNIFYKSIKLILLAILTGASASCSDKEAEYTGILEHRPEGKDGMWVIDGKSFSVTEEVELEEKHGPLSVGACVEFETEDGVVTEIESENMEKCQPEKSK